MKMKALFLITIMVSFSIVSLFSLGFIDDPLIINNNDLNRSPELISEAINYEWWDSSWNYRVQIDINSTVHFRFDQMIQIMVNFTKFFQELDVQGSLQFDMNSIRVIEYNSMGSMVIFNQSETGLEKYTNPSLFNPIWNFNTSTNARGQVIWIMNGTTAKNQNRTYFIYFDLYSNGPKSSPTIRYHGTDFNDNGQKEIIFGREAGRIFMFNGTGLGITHQIRDDQNHYEFRSNDYGSWDGIGLALADTDNDGEVELLACDYDSSSFWVFGYNKSVPSSPASGKVNRLIMEFQAPALGGYTYSIGAADLDNDGTTEIVVNVWSSGYRLKIFGWNGTTYVQEGETERLSAGIIPFTIADVDQDGTLEIIGGRWDSSAARFYVYGFNGLVYQREYESPDLGRYLSGVAVGNIDNDANIEIIVGTYGNESVAQQYNGSLYVFEYKKSLESSWPTPPYILEYKSPVAVGYMVSPTDIADWDNDGTLEVAVGTYRQPNNLIPANVLVYNFTAGILKEEWRANNSQFSTDYYMRGPKFSDIDKDGTVELLVGSYNGFIRIYNSTRTNYEYISTDMGTSVASWIDSLIISGEISYTESPTLITPPAITIAHAEVKTATFTVRTLDVDKNIISNAHVYFNNGTFIWEETTDETGTVVFYEFPEGIYNITVTYTTIVNPTTSYTITINYTENTQILWTTSNPEINISCDLARFTFNVTDIDNSWVTPGWICIGNNTMILDNITLNTNGMGLFRWKNSTNMFYNFSVFYYAPPYTGSPLLINKSIITNTALTRGAIQQIKTNLTTLLIQVVDEIHVPIEGATVQIWNCNATQLVALKTDSSGLATFRWTKAEAPLNYTLFILMRGERFLVNESVSGDPSWKWSFNFTLSNGNQYSPNLRVIVNWNLSNFISSLERINPSYSITTYKNSLVTIQVQFNTTNLVEIPPTPTPDEASQCTYKIYNAGRTIVLASGSLNYLSWGRYTLTLDTSASIYSSNALYHIDIDAFKIGYQKPPTKSFTLILTDGPVSFESSEGEDSAIKAIWTETKQVSLTYNGIIPESILIDDAVTRIANISGNSLLNTYISALNNDWNLTYVAFNFSQIFTPINQISDPTLYQMNVTYNGKAYPVQKPLDWYGYCEIPATGLNLYESAYSFGVEGITLKNYTVVVTAGWIRSFVHGKTYLSDTNETNIILDGTDDYRNINYLKFEFSNIRDLSNNLINSTNAYMNITVPDEVGTNYNISTGSETGTGYLDLLGLNLYPSKSFHFILNYTNVKSYSLNITVGYRSNFITHPRLETKGTISELQNKTTPNPIDLEMPVNQWNLTSIFLQIVNIKKAGTTEQFFPSSHNLKVTLNNIGYDIFDTGNGSGEVQIPILTLKGDEFFNFNVSGDIDFTYDCLISRIYSNDQYFPVSDASILWVAEDPTVNGICPESNLAGQYTLTFDTTRMDAGEWGSSSGNHYLRVTAVKTGYDSPELTLIFDVRKVDTTLNGSKTNYDTLNLLVTYFYNITYLYFDEFGNGIENADVLYYEWEMSNNRYINGTGSLIEIGNGTFILDFAIKNLDLGSYDLFMEISKDNYRAKVAGLHINILTIPTNAIPVAERLEPEQGQIVNFTIPYRDIINSVYLGNASYTLTGLPAGSYTIVENPTGSYSIIIDTKSLGLTSYSITFTLSKTNYTTQEIALLLVVRETTIFGIPLSWFIIIMITLTATIGVLATYYGIKRARIPFIIKKLDETQKIIQKGKASALIPITKSKNDLFTNFFKTEWNYIGLTPPALIKAKKIDEFISILGTAKVRMTPSEAEKLMAKLKTLSKQESLDALGNLGIPPDTSERLFNLASVSEEIKDLKK